MIKVIIQYFKQSCRDKKKMLVPSNFSFSHNVFSRRIVANRDCVPKCYSGNEGYDTFSVVLRNEDFFLVFIEV